MKKLKEKSAKERFLFTDKFSLESIVFPVIIVSKRKKSPKDDLCPNPKQ
jgi:hypothetical protein